MRKGRSQRKARSSLLPLSQAPRSAQPSAEGAARGGSGPGPQVVIGLSDQPSQPPSSEHAELLDSHGRAEGAGSRIPVTTQIGVPKLQSSAPEMPKLVLSEPSLELVREAERLELVREKSLEIVRESLELVRESLAESAALAASPEETHDTSHDTSDECPSSFDQSDDDASSSSGSGGSDFTLTESQPPVACAESAESVESLAPHTTSLLTPEEQSIPPVVGLVAHSRDRDLAVEPIAERFFSEGELVAHETLEDEEWDQAQDKAIRKSLPHVVERRAHLAKYVRWAVGGAAVVCLAALGSSLIPRASRSAPTASAAAALEAPPPAPKAADVAVVAEVKRAPVAEVAPASPAAAAPAKADDLAIAPVAQTPEPAKTEAAKAEPAKADEAAKVVTGDKTAAEEKKDARRALERGKTADAIAAGERSVALDPTDGEAWLLLGAAYQEKGKNAEARRCYASCLKEGKRGPLGECRAMVR